MPILDWTQNKDVRSFDHLYAGAETNTYSRAWPAQVPLDQQQDGSCTGHGIATALASMLDSVGQHRNAARIDRHVAALCLYELATSRDEFKGDWPTADTGSSVNGVMKAARDYPPLFQQVVAANDFTTSFLWISERMDLLPSFSVGPVVLLGDAAHPLLAFTSQGANSALEDAACLSALLSRKLEERPIDDTLQRYYREREPRIRRYIADGDQLVEQFMRLEQDKNFQLPLSLH